MNFFTLSWSQSDHVKQLSLYSNFSSRQRTKAIQTVTTEEEEELKKKLTYAAYTAFGFCAAAPVLALSGTVGLGVGAVGAAGLVGTALFSYSSHQNPQENILFF